MDLSELKYDEVKHEIYPFGAFLNFHHMKFEYRDKSKRKRKKQINLFKALKQKTCSTSSM